MPADTKEIFSGIIVERSFYSEAYLTDIVGDDLKGVYERWAALGDASPAAGIRCLAASWADMKAELDAVLDAESRRETQRAWLRHLLEVLGYDWSPEIRALDGEEDGGFTVALLAEVTKADGRPDLWIVEAEPSADLDDPLASTVNGGTLEDAITESVFAGDEPPR